MSKTTARKVGGLHATPVVIFVVVFLKISTTHHCFLSQQLPFFGYTKEDKHVGNTFSSHFPSFPPYAVEMSLCIATSHFLLLEKQSVLLFSHIVGDNFPSSRVQLKKCQFSVSVSTREL